MKKPVSTAKAKARKMTDPVLSEMGFARVEPIKKAKYRRKIDYIPRAQRPPVPGAGTIDGQPRYKTTPMRLLLPPLRAQPVTGWHPEWAETVVRYRAAGLTIDQCARLLDVDSVTLGHHYERELYMGRSHVVAEVATKLVAKALDGDTACMMFFLKTQGGWKEITRSEVGGPDGAPIPIAAVTLDGKNLTPDQRAVLRHALQIAVHGKVTDG